MSLILGAISIFCIIYYIFAGSYAGFNSTFLNFWIIAAIIFAVLSLIFYFKTPKIIRLIIFVSIMFSFIFFLIVESLIYSYMTKEAEESASYIIVLGAQIRGERVTKSLAKRLDEAVGYLDENPNCMVIVSGGQGQGENITEAEAMKRYLINKNIDKSRIIKEDKSTSTKENLIFSYEMIEDKEKSIGVVTNNFHVYRAVKLAKKIGIKNVSGLAADADNKLLLNYMVREFFAIIKEKIAGNI